MPADHAPPQSPQSAPVNAPRAFLDAPEPGLSGRWSGTYSYDEASARAPVYFLAELVLTGDTVTGHIVEPNTFVDGPQAELHATVLGELGEDGTIAFYKRYDGTAGVSHTVVYEGRLDEQRTRVEGHWRVGSTVGGEFVMARQPRPSGLARGPRRGIGPSAL